MSGHKPRPFNSRHMVKDPAHSMSATRPDEYAYDLHDPDVVAEPAPPPPPPVIPAGVEQQLVGHHACSGCEDCMVMMFQFFNSQQELHRQKARLHGNIIFSLLGVIALLLVFVLATLKNKQ